MHFLTHGAIHPDAQAALSRHGHACHALPELAEEAGAPDMGAPEMLLPLLAKRQWNLLTTDADFVHALYERGVRFAGVIVLILADPAEPQAQDKAVDRLFERYKRLSPRRLYTVTASRVKIRQLPGAAQA